MGNRNVVRLLTEGVDAGPVVLGGKGTGLAEMAALKLPIPPGFVITTSVSRALRQEGRFPKRLEWHLQRGINELEAKTGKRFGDCRRPLLVSVRSGAPVSMPGMMETILNLGINRDVSETLAERYNANFAQDCLGRFVSMFTKVTDIKLIPEDPMEQLRAAIQAVCNSWDNPRAIAYRKANNIPDWHGTAVVIQEMVFGNLDERSCTGVVFSRNVTSGQPGLYGEFLVQAQGEDVVSGENTGRPISEMRTWNQAVYGQLEQLVLRLEKHFGYIVDVEFTVESGRLFLLQVRRAKPSPLAAVTSAVHDVWSGQISKEKVLAGITREQLESLERASFGKIPKDATIIATGLPVSAGAVVGKLAFSSAKAIEMAKAGESVVLVRPDTTPDDLEGMLAAKAIVTFNGGATCHAAVVARGMDLAAVVGCGALLGSTPLEGDVVSVDGLAGKVFKGEIPLAESACVTKEVELLKKWARALRPDLAWAPPGINWSGVRRSLSMNRVLANFYLSDALAAVTRGKALGVRASMLREKVHREAAEFLACYLILAVWGELRYISHLQPEPKQVGILERLKQFGFDPINDYPSDNRGHERGYEALSGKSLAHVVSFLDLAVEAFRDLAWGSAIGGPAWARIAQAVRDYLGKRVSQTVFVDHVFDLRHNGGRLFDKHSMVQSTDEYVLAQQLELKKRIVRLEDLFESWGYLIDPELKSLLYEMYPQRRGK